MVDVITLPARERDQIGKGGARAARRAGDIPAIIYGGDNAPLSVTVTDKEISAQLAIPGFFTRQFSLEMGSDSHRVLPREVQFHPVTDRPLHVDFLRITANTKVTVEVPIIFENEEESPGLKAGGVLNIVRHSVEVNCRADAIPSSFVLDLKGFDIGESLHASTVDLGEGVSFTITDRDFTIATIAAPTVMAVEEAVEEGEEGAEGEDAAEGTGDNDAGSDGD